MSGLETHNVNLIDYLRHKIISVTILIVRCLKSCKKRISYSFNRNENWGRMRMRFIKQKTF